VGESRQALTSAVLRVLAPLDGSGCACGTHEPLRARRLRAPRRFAALFHAARALWSRPTELSLPEEPYPLSRASCFRAGSRSTAQRRGTTRSVRGPFRLSRRPLATAGLAARRTVRPGRRFPGVARALRVTGCPARVQRSVPRIAPGSPDSAAGTPASKLCSPRESVLATARPWPGMVSRLGRCSLGLVPSRACSSSPVGPVFARANVVGCEPVPRASSSTRHLATSIRQARAPVAGSRTRDPPA